MFKYWSYKAAAEQSVVLGCAVQCRLVRGTSAEKIDWSEWKNGRNSTLCSPCSGTGAGPGGGSSDWMSVWPRELTSLLHLNCFKVQDKNAQTHSAHPLWRGRLALQMRHRAGREADPERWGTRRRLDDRSLVCIWPLWEYSFQNSFLSLWTAKSYSNPCAFSENCTWDKAL